MWSKIKTIASTCLVFIAGILGFIFGMLLYSKKLDKPETSVTNETNIDIAKIKAKGDGNVSVTLPVPEHTTTTTTAVVTEPSKKKFKLFKKNKS
jgi:hypothetical protein